MDSVASTPGLRWQHSAGLVAYDDAVRRMEAEIAAIRDGAPELVWLLEHPPLYTAGSSARDEDLLAPGRFPRHLTGRGGQWTYHGPGQRVAYVMLNLARAHGSVPPRDLHLYVAGLERWIITALAAFGVRGERRARRVGVWVANGAGREAKIAAVGVRVTRWVSWHGVAVNVSPDLSHYDGIVPCGIRDHGVTSLRALGVNAELPELDIALQQTWAKIFVQQ